MRVPSSTPGGIATCRVRSRCTRAGAVADLAGVADHPALAAAGRAGALDQEEALLRAHLAGAAAGRAGVGRARLVLGAGAGAGIARPRASARAGSPWCRRRLRPARSRRPGGCRCRARLRPAAPPRRPPMKSPNIWSKMSPRPPPAEKSKPALKPPAAALLEGGMAVAVVGGALLVVLQDVVGLVDLLELAPRPACRPDCGRGGACMASLR